MLVDFAYAPSETLIIRPPEFFNYLKQSVTRAASLGLIEQALAKLDPRIAAEVRQGRGEKARKDFLDGEPELTKRQMKVSKDYEGAYKTLPQTYKAALIALAP